MRQFANHIDASVEYIRPLMEATPTVGVVLGSGLGDFASLLLDPIIINTKDIPHYPVSTIDGHAGKILFGKIQALGKMSADIMVFQGRIHFYESNDTDVVVFPIEVAHRLGITKLIVTNAAGGVNRQLAPGDLMFIKDYMNLSFENPLIGRTGIKMKNSGATFSHDLLSRAKEIALENRIPFKEGVYCWTKGPSYESAAEIRMMGAGGADAVGMSTVPEVIVAASYGMEVLGISCITNFATGLTTEKLAHAEVKKVANTVKHNFTELVSKIIIEL
jgi:purine-nucleoside phosphorylase